jgi:PAS domain S-box-containing protein
MVLTAIASVVMAPFWGHEGWTRLVGLTDATEPLVAWLLYHQCFRGSLTFNRLRDAIAFIISAPLLACGITALVGSSTLLISGKLSTANLTESMGHWWLGNAIGTLAITPTALLVFTPLLQRWGKESEKKLTYPLPRLHNQVEFAVILILSLCTVWLTVWQSQSSLYTLQHLSLLSFIPILWAAIQFGTTGGMLVATFTVLVTLLVYLLVHPHALALPYFPVNPQLLHLHKLVLLVECGVGLLVGTAMAERSIAQVALIQEQVRSTEYQAQAQLSEQLFQLNRLLTEANQKLSESEERFRTSVENMADCFGVYCAIRDQTGQIIDFCIEYVNDAACVSNGISREEQLGRGLCELLPQHCKNGLFDEYCQVVETGQSLVKETLVYKDGEEQPDLVRAFDIQIAKFGDGFVATWRDVTERRQVEEALRQKQEWLDLAQTIAKLGSFEWNIKTHANRWSKELEALYGLKPGEFGGTHEDWLRYVHRDDVTKVEADILDAWTSGEIATDFRVIWPDGSIHWLQARGRVFYDEQGQPARLVGVNVDITEQKQIEMALRYSQVIAKTRAEELETFMETVPAAVWIAHDPQCHYMTANRAASELMRLPPSSVMSAAPIQGQYPFPFQIRQQGQNIPLQELPMQQAALRGQAVEAEFELVFADDDVQLIYGKAVPLRDVSGAVRGVIGAFLDVTEQQTTLRELRRVEAALRQKQERLDLAQTAAKLGSFEWNIQSNINIWSPELEALYGLNSGEFRGTYQEWARWVHPEDLAQAEADVRSAMETGELLTNWRVVWRDGSVHWLHARAKVFFDEDGKPLRMVGVNVDITNQKQAEEALQESESRLRPLVDSNIIGIIEVEQNQITFANEAFLQMLGYSQADVDSGKLYWQEMTPPEYRELDHAKVADVFNLGFCTPFEKEYTRKDGQRVPILLGAALLSRHPLKWVCFILDLTERKKVEAALRQAIEERAQALERERAARMELERASRLKDEFLAIVSHELRSPLNGILGWSRLLRTRKLDAQKTEQALASIERNAQAQTQLIEDLLDISRIIRGAIRLNLRPTDLIPAIEAALDTVRPMASAKSIQIESYLDPQVGMVSGDPDRLQQIVWNLLSNAIKFTPAGGRVDIRLESIDFYAQFQVSDTGKGIDPEFLPRVFERFHQADATTTRTQGGLGLGLAIVRNLVELHGGRIYAESQGEGQGATFTVELPLLPNYSDATQERTLFLQRQTNWETSVNLNGIKILAVDDEADAREFLKTALEQYGAVVTTATCAHEALELLPTVEPDVILSDIGMPMEDGYSLMRQIRALPPEQGGRIPAAALTAYAREGDRLQALAAGFQMHVPKPIEPFQLLSVILRLANKSNDSATSPYG